MFKVLLVDDEPFVAKALSVLIDWEGLGYSICGEASNGEEAVKLIIALTPDVVITDIRMPKVDGLALVKYCSETLKSSSKFIILSGYSDFKYAQQALRYGVKEYLLKPVDEYELINALNALKSEFTKREQKLEESYKQAKSAIVYRFYEITDSSELNKSKIKYSSETSFEGMQFINKLVEAIEDDKEESVKALIDHIFAYFYESLSALEAVKIYINSMIVEIVKLISDNGGEADSFMQQHSSYVNSLEELNFEAVKKNTLVLCLEGINYIKSLKNASSRGIINEVEKYIRKHYMEDINLKIISEKFYINSVYLGQQFKKHFGVHFNDYLNEIRVEEAKKLLARTNKKIYEIAECVGYKNRDYFVGRFQKSTNMSPSEYKKSLQN